MTKNQLQRIPETSISRALKSSNSLELAKATTALSLPKIMHHEAERQRLNDELDTALNSVRFLGALVTEGKADRSDLDQAVAQVKKLEAQLEPYRPLLSLRQLAQQDEKATLQSLQLLIINLVDYFENTEPISIANIQEIALLVLAEGGWLTLDDVALCFRNAKTARGGAFYNRLDGSVIMQWLQNYMEEKRKIWSLKRDDQVYCHKSDAGYGREYTRPVSTQKLGELIQTKEEVNAAREKISKEKK